jgi:rubrerythrin
MIRTLDEEVAFTQAWWERVNKDEGKLLAWLKKLYGTEIGGYDDYQSFLISYDTDLRTRRILENVADDEKKHSLILVDVLAGRGHTIDPDAPASEYWKTLDSHITDIYSACAANYYGEALAAFRFEVIVDMACTPSDVKEALRIILPDEQFHRQTLKRLAGDEQLAKFQQIHEDAVAALKGEKK